jgi:hypothetical protein
LGFAGVTSGTATITAQAAAGNPTLTLPNTSGTLADGASSPLVLSAATGNLTCPTCVTSSGGGAITGVSPVNVSAAGAVSLQGANGTIAQGSGGTGSAFTATPTLGVAGSAVGTLTFDNATSGGVTIQPATGALGTAVATLPAGTYNFVGDSLTQTLTNKTLTAPIIATIINTGTLTLPTATDTLVGRATTDTLTNKTISGASNTITNVPVSSGISGLGTGVGTALGNSLNGTGGLVGFNGNIGAATGTSLDLTSSSANALTAGATGSTNPAFNVDASTASSVTGLNVKSAAAGSGIALSAISSATNENLHLNAKGSGIVEIGDVSTGGVVLGGPAAAVTGGVVQISGTGAPQLNFVSTAGSNVAQFFANGGIWAIATQGVGDWMHVDLTTGMLSALTSFSSPVPKTETASFTMGNADSSLIFNCTATCVLTLPSATAFPGRWLHVKTVAAQALNSATSNVVPLTSVTPGTAILAATSGKWARLQSDGTNWQIMEQGGANSAD